MLIAAKMIGFCLIAVILAVVALKNVQKGKEFKNVISAGIAIYILALIGTFAGGKDVGQIIGCVLSIIILIVAFVVCKKKA